MLTRLVQLLAGLPPWLIVLLAFGLALGEGAVLLDLIVPGEVGLVLVGAVAAERGVPLGAAMAACAIGAVVGDSIGWWLGRHGTPLLERNRWIRKRLKPRLERAEGWFEDKGGAAVAIGRWVGALRAVVPVAAGAAKMPYGRFLLWDVPAAATWGATIVWVGHTFGRRAAELVDRAGPWVYAAVGVAVLLVIGRSVWKKRSDEKGSDEG